MPQRTCIGCREVTASQELVRLALARDESQRVSVVVDEKRELPGRGAWIHRDPVCVQQAVRRKASSRAFRQAVDDSRLSAWLPARDTP